MLFSKLRGNIIDLWLNNRRAKGLRSARPARPLLGFAPLKLLSTLPLVLIIARCLPWDLLRQHQTPPLSKFVG